MNTHTKARMIFVGLTGALLLAATAGSATAQARYYPDGTNCSILSDDELVACQNQIYTRQLESGISQQAADPTDTPIASSHIEGNEAGQSDFVPGSEGTELPGADLPGSGPAALLPGPEGTIRSGPTE